MVECFSIKQTHSGPEFGRRGHYDLRPELDSTHKEMLVRKFSRQSVLTFAIAFSLSTIVLALAAPSPTLAQEEEHLQCLAREECRALREQIREYKQELRPMRRELRELKQRIRETPEGEERDALIAKARELRREIKQLRREARPTVRRFRAGCRPVCFES